MWCWFIKTQVGTVRRFLPLTALALSLTVLTPSGCVPWRDSPEERIVQEATKALAPAGGTGAKIYRYASGELKEKVYWDRYRVVRIEYYDLKGTLLYAANPRGRHAILLTVGSDGTIEEIYEATDFVRDGNCFVLQGGRLRAIKNFRYDELMSETTITGESEKNK